MNAFMRFVIDVIVKRRSRGEEWQPGDLAVCIADNWIDSEPANPKLNEYLRVEMVCAGGLWLHFQGKPSRLHWEANAFRKVRPDTKAADDEAWVDQLRHLRRKVHA